MNITGFPAIAITDSTATGRALVTSANVAAARASLGLATTDAPTFAGLAIDGPVGIQTAANPSFSLTCAGAIRSNSLITVSSNSGYYAIGASGDCILFRGAANIWEQRVGINPQTWRTYNTYSFGSGTNASNNISGEWLAAEWISNAAWITTRAGSSGGSARDLILGTNGAERIRLTAAGTGQGVQISTGATITTATSQPFIVTGSSVSSCEIRFSSVSRTYAFVSAGSSPVGGDYSNLSPGQFGLIDGTAGLFRLTCNTAGNFGIGTFSPVGRLEVAGGFTMRPAASVTLTTNGQFSFEVTSNTAGNLVYRGSDGVTRRMALTFT